MKKNLLAAAVAGALIAPGMAMAQSSTVQIYGLFNVEYGFYDAPNNDGTPSVGRNSIDQINSGASRIGFKGEEKLGGGLSAWFQCESDLRFNGGVTTQATAGSWCDRNSALGLRGGWGNFFIGNWDSPIKQVTTATRMLNETGIFGAQHLLMTFAGFNYSTRNINSLNYASPNMNGFSMNAQMTTENPARNSLDNAAGQATQWRHLGLNGIYRSGPLVAGLGWSRIENQGPIAALPGVWTAGPHAGRDDEALALGVNYTFGAFKAGVVWTKIEVERGANAIVGANAERDSVSFALDWRLGGPGMVRFGATLAGRTKVDGGGCDVCGSAVQYQISYNHSFSKRTTGTIGAVLLDNGGGGVYNLQGQGQSPFNEGTQTVFPGEKTHAFGIGLAHSF